MYAPELLLPGRYVTVIVKGWQTGIVYKTFLATKRQKKRPPALKNLSHVSRSRDLSQFGLMIYQVDQPVPMTAEL